MRDKKRIDRILNLIKKEWKKNPDQRFYQSLINMGVMPDGNWWNIEDDELEKHLKEFK